MSGKNLKKSDQVNKSRSKSEWTLCAQCDALYISDKTATDVQHKCVQCISDIDPETGCFVIPKESAAYLSPVDHSNGNLSLVLSGRNV